MVRVQIFLEAPTLSEENMKGNVYLVVHDLTFYFNERETVISDRLINSLYQHADYVYVQNEFGHWKFLKTVLG